MLDLVTYCQQAIRYLARQKNGECFELFLYKLPAINEILTVLKIPYDATVAMQKTSYTLSDFYGSWLAIVRRLEKLATAPGGNTEFAQTLLAKIRARESSLINTELMMCAVFLDKRYDFKLTDNEKKIARTSLEELFNRLKEGKQQRSTENSDAVNSDEDSFEKECIAAGHAKIRRVDSCISDKDDKCFAELIASYEDIDRLYHTCDILAFWEEQKTLHPEIYELAAIIHSIPPTQCTVERSFSVMGYIFDSRRTRLSPSMLENILLINLNRDMVDEINNRDLVQL